MTTATVFRLRRPARAPWWHWQSWSLTTNELFILDRTWGPRRISSRAAAVGVTWPGEPVTATVGLWLAWYRTQRKFRQTYVIIVPEGADHGEVYVQLLNARTEAEARAAIVQAMTPDRIEAVQRRRAEARAAKDFALADALRAELVAAGVTVADERVS